jgi:hypothetical protein
VLSKAAAVTLVALAGIPAILVGEVLTRLGQQLAAGREPAILAACGILGGAIVYSMLSRHSGEFWSTTHHELAHACMATLVGGAPKRLLVDGASGHVNWSMSKGPLSAGRSFLVLIAPYCVSPISVCVTLLLLVVPTRTSGMLLAASICAGIGLAAPLLEVHPRQRDLRQAGFVMSIACSLWLWTSTLVVLLIALSSRTSAAAVADAYVRAGTSAAHFLMSLIHV